MPFIEFPNVPNVPGVPAIPRLSDEPIAPVQPASTPVQNVQLGIQRNDKSRWGIYDADGNALGNPSLFIDTAQDDLSTNSLEFSKKMRISEFPVEQGTFANYNKVELPAEPIVTLAYGGSENERSEFLRQIEVATDSLDLYSVVTPEVTYINFSVADYAYSRRSENGVSLLLVRITLKQIRQVTAQFTSSNEQIRDPQSENAVAEVDNGKVQPGATDDATNKALTKKGLL